ncbi:MAG: hypothetical protein VW454_06225 [Pelagibacteraceae bacterium]|jgi:hypothetical protein
MRSLTRSIRIWLWGIVAELEYQLYPWKTDSPPKYVEEKYVQPPDYEKNFNDDWLKAHDEKIARLQQEMIWVQQEIHKLHVHNRTGA